MADSNRKSNLFSIVDDSKPIFLNQERYESSAKAQHSTLESAKSYLASKYAAQPSVAPELSDQNGPANLYIHAVQEHYDNPYRARFKLNALHGQKSGEYQSTDLLWAASKNDVSLIQTILAQPNIDINVKGKFGETPLHVAAITGSTEAIETLLAQGANANLKAYKDYDHPGFTPMELALADGHTDAACMLYALHATGGMSNKTIFEFALEQHMVNLVSTMIDNGILKQYSYDEILDLAWDQVFEFTDLTETANSEADYHTLQDIADILLLLAPHSGTVIVDDPMVDFEIPPMSVWLDIFAAEIENPHVHQIMIDTSDKLDEIDHNKESYLMAKALFHIVPVEGLYTITYNGKTGHPNHGLVNGEGFYHIYTVPLGFAAISGYLERGDITSSAELSAFQAAYNTLNTASMLSDRLGLQSTAEEFYDAFQQGETILLPSGWAGHAVDIVVNAEQGLLMIANNGLRFDDLDSGLSIFQMNNPDNFSPALIHDILLNQDQTNLELKLAAKLGLVEIDHIMEPDQFTGNCAWQSQESAIEGILFIDLLQQGYSFEDAKALAQDYYHTWDEFQTLAFVEGYLNDDPRISTEAITALIKTQAFLLDTHDIQTLKADPLGEILINAYENHTHKNADHLKLDYNPFDDWGWKPESWGDHGSNTDVTVRDENANGEGTLVKTIVLEDVIHQPSAIDTAFNLHIEIHDSLVTHTVPSFEELSLQDVPAFGH